MLHIPQSLAGVHVSGVEMLPGVNGVSGLLNGMSGLVSTGRWTPPKVTIPDPASIIYPEAPKEEAQQQGGQRPNAAESPVSWLSYKHSYVNPGLRAERMKDELANPPLKFRDREKLLERIGEMNTRTGIITSLGALRAYHRRCSVFANMWKITWFGLRRPVKKEAKDTCRHSYFITRAPDASAMLYMTEARGFSSLGQETTAYMGRLHLDMPRRRILVKEAHGHEGKQAPEVDLIVGTFLNVWFRGAVDVFLGDDPAFFA